MNVNVNVNVNVNECGRAVDDERTFKPRMLRILARGLAGACASPQTSVRLALSYDAGARALDGLTVRPAGSDVPGCPRSPALAGQTCSNGACSSAGLDVVEISYAMKQKREGAAHEVRRSRFVITLARAGLRPSAQHSGRARQASISVSARSWSARGRYAEALSEFEAGYGSASQSPFLQHGRVRAPFRRLSGRARISGLSARSIRTGRWPRRPRSGWSSSIARRLPRRLPQESRLRPRRPSPRPRRPRRA